MTHPKITNWHFVRHAPVVKQSGHLPSYDAPIIDPGISHPGMNHPGFDHLRSALPSGADWHISPLTRTRQTADLLMPALAPKSVGFDDNLIEMSFGDWHEQPVSDVWESISDKPRHNWSFIMPDTIPPNGDSFETLCQRVSAWMDQQAAKTLSDNPHIPTTSQTPKIVITHAGVIRAALRHILDIDPIHAIGIEIVNLGVLRANVMGPDKATDAGGSWQFVSLG